MHTISRKIQGFSLRFPNRNLETGKTENQKEENSSVLLHNGSPLLCLHIGQEDEIQLSLAFGLLLFSMLFDDLNGPAG